jgi:hypothetical protein
VVLVHGAFADAPGFAGVIRHLQAQGAPVRVSVDPLAQGLILKAVAVI